MTKQRMMSSPFLSQTQSPFNHLTGAKTQLFILVLSHTSFYFSILMFKNLPFIKSFDIIMMLNDIIIIMELIYMSRILISFRIDQELKKSAEQVCEEMGMSLSTAFTVFAKKLIKERKIPFEIEAEPLEEKKSERSKKSK